MKFRFCGGLEPPDWVLAEVPLLSRLSQDDMLLICETLADDIMVQAVVSLLQFVLRSSAKHNISCTEFALELQQLGLEKSLGDIVAHVYECNVVNVREQLKRESFKFSQIESVDWKIRQCDGAESKPAESMAPAQKIELTIKLDQVVHTNLGAIVAKSDGDTCLNKTKDGSKLEITMDREKFFSLYEELLQAHALLQHIQL
uniref:COMM domain-containing protein n=1 Tax=Globisporangium ultimum (strain ATCC 200006 / CBS 805.95 / DAOM BR144) TaxID=431595 RepID=K3WZP4_GLOUD